MPVIDREHTPAAIAVPFPTLAAADTVERKPISLLLLADRILAGTLLAAALPVMTGVALAIRLMSRRSPLVAHLRVGHNGLPFWMLKFRTMWPKTSPLPRETGWIEQIVKPEFRESKPLTDPRVTSRFAAWCRAHSIDELPQLWHALRGEMSLVGPRPLTQFELDKHYGDHAQRVLERTPGMTGLWQVLGRNSLTYKQRLRLDLFLARNYSWPVYVWILIKTIRKVFTGTGA